MADLVLKNLTLPDGTVTDVTLSGGKITSVSPTEACGRDCTGLKAMPGLFDIHTHGCGGVDTMEAGLESLSAFHLSHGTTSYLATTMTAPIEDLKKVCATPMPQAGARCEGFHLEGPFLSPKAAGAQNSAYLTTPSYPAIADLPGVRMVTVAPELEGAMDFIRTCPCPVSLGHTVADYSTALAAARAGAKCLTHTFNAMPPLHHREPGVIGAAITENLYVQVICDGIHIHPAVVTALYRIFGRERMILISDSMPATGVTDGKYLFGGIEMTVTGGVARTPDGKLAGSTSTLLDCVKKAIEFGIPEEDAYYMASRTPALLCGLKKGLIAPGYDAELLLLSQEGELVEAICLR